MFSIMQKKTASTKPRQDRRGANSIQLAPDLSERLGTVKGIAGTATKAHLARLALEWALSKLESGECVITNGKFVCSGTHRQAA